MARQGATRLAALTLLAAAGASAAPAPPPAVSRQFDVVAANGTRIGRAARVTRDGPAGRETIETQAVELQAGVGAVVEQTDRMVVRTDPAGQTISISDEAATGRVWTRTEARIVGDRALITRRTPHARWSATVALPPGVRFDGGEGLLATWDPATTPSLAFDNLDLDAMVVQRVTLTVDQSAPPPAGGVVAVRRRYEGGQLMAFSRLTLDASHRLVAVAQPMFGGGLTLAASDSAAAPVGAYQSVENAMVKSPYRIPPSAQGGHIRYRFGFAGESFDLPQTGEQRASVEAGEVTLDICDGCGPGLATDKATLAAALRPTAWLERDDARIQALARPVARARLSDTRKMQLLTDLTAKLLTEVDFTTHVSALETLERRASDCTGTAVLLAALGRAAGIPTLVADGLVYSRERYHGVSNAFMPHSWVLAYVDGRWRSFDAALDSFDSTHIALIVGDGDMRYFTAAGQLATLLKWDGMTEVRKPPAA